MLTLERKHGITLRSSKVFVDRPRPQYCCQPWSSAAVAQGAPRRRPRDTDPPRRHPRHRHPPPPTSSGLVVPGIYNMETMQDLRERRPMRNDVEFPRASSRLSSGVTHLQLRGDIRFEADGTFFHDSWQRTDSPLGEGPEQSFFGGGTFNVAGALVSFKATPGTVAPGTVTIGTDGSLLRFYDIPLEPPFVPPAVTVNVTETYRLIR